MALIEPIVKNPPRTLFSALPMEIKSHSVRVGFVVNEMARYCAGEHDCFGFKSKTALTMAILDGGQYHDIGKIMVSNNVLIKGGHFSEAEEKAIRQHPIRSEEIICEFGNAFFASEAHKQLMLDMAKHHHERIDGSGYPHGLAGAEIPLIAQLCGIADIFDNSICLKIYRRKPDYESVKNMILQSEGVAFGQQALSYFLKAYDNIKENYVEKEKSIKRI